LFKPVYTYNNGNIYGLSMATLTPLCFRLEHRPLFKMILVASMPPSLSRTLWLLTALALLMTYGGRTHTSSANCSGRKPRSLRGSRHIRLRHLSRR